MSFDFQQIGLSVVNFIIFVAGWLTKNESAPGLVAIGLLGVLFLSAFYIVLRTRRRKAGVRKIQRLIAVHDTPEAFSNNYESTCNEIRKFATSGNKPTKSTAVAWGEYSETIINPRDEAGIRYNSIRPSMFFDADDLGFVAGFTRILPNLFVSCGLLFTFLGLVAALWEFSQTISGSGDGMDLAMKNFMQIASAKFIMSLVGLACSIFTTIILRFESGTIDKALHGLCATIEERVEFLSLEALAQQQLEKSEEQTAQLKEVATTMIAQLAQPLEALPSELARTLSDKMDPIFDRVSSMGTSSMTGLANDLSEQLSHSVGNALQRASDSLGEAADRLGEVADRMTESNSQAGNELNAALEQMASSLTALRTEVFESGQAASSSMATGAEQMLASMNEALSGIRQNTAEGSEAIRLAASDLKDAAEQFRDQISGAAQDGADAVSSQMQATSDQASQAILASFEGTGQEIARLGREVGETVGTDIMARLQEVGQGLERASASINQGAESASTASAGMGTGAQALTGAAEVIAKASRDLSAATEPVRASHERIEGGLNSLQTSISDASVTVSEASREIAVRAEQVLGGVSDALATERASLAATLLETRQTMAMLENQASKLDDIDLKLGEAMVRYNAQLEAALHTAQGHTTTMSETLAPAVETLRQVVEQAEQFVPSQRGRG